MHNTENGIIDDEDEFGEEEYAAINSMLDQINSYLDDLEERNDALNGKLHELLESNRQARQEFRAQLLESQKQEGQSIQGENQSAELSASPASKEDQNADREGSQISDQKT
uniref:Bublin coiled coil protein n=1 Tax=Oryzias melastigma TaxID=30732 RepID=A0A3B3D262_ORYME